MGGLRRPGLRMQLERSGSETDLRRTVELQFQKASLEHANALPPDVDCHGTSCDFDLFEESELQAEVSTQEATPAAAAEADDGKFWTRILVLVIAMLYGANAAPVCLVEGPLPESSLRLAPTCPRSARRLSVQSSAPCLSSRFLSRTHQPAPAPPAWRAVSVFRRRPPLPPSHSFTRESGALNAGPRTQGQTSGRSRSCNNPSTSPWPPLRALVRPQRSLSPSGFRVGFPISGFLLWVRFVTAARDQCGSTTACLHLFPFTNLARAHAVPLQNILQLLTVFALRTGGCWAQGRACSNWLCVSHA